MSFLHFFSQTNDSCLSVLSVFLINKYNWKQSYELCLNDKSRNWVKLERLAILGFWTLKYDSDLNTAHRFSIIGLHSYSKHRFVLSTKFIWFWLWVKFEFFYVQTKIAQALQSFNGNYYGKIEVIHSYDHILPCGRIVLMKVAYFYMRKIKQ